MSAAPSPATTPQPLNELPCQSDPDRWFDRAERTHALAGCLACPVRVWCAREALAGRASSGMWAGIWIDGDLAEAAHYLEAIADGKSSPPPPVESTNVSIATPRCSVVIGPPAKHTVAALITARSSSHCEIMAPDCTLGLETIASRIPSCHRLSDASAGYAACRSCQAMVARMEPRLSRRLGYVVDNPANAATIPFYWRQTRWMRVDSAGGAAECSTAERIA